ncbi:phage head-binding domain-containing protein [Proteus sp. G2667]|uniref:phage head-binding domain-containing protein n=1 Tax=Proteus sp. G2667 TaxID=2698880 RepID=UPI001F1CA478|nr:phage head-binding domain-containing protein [Proteus sp. G2667]
MSDIIPNVVVSMPSQLFTLARKFQAASNGKIFIGKIDSDPTIPENQIQVYLENEDGSHIPVPQPLIINQAGFPVFGGQIAKFVTVEGHSMAVYDSYGAQQFYYPNVLKYDPDQFKEKLKLPTGASMIGVQPAGNLQQMLNFVTPEQFESKMNGSDDWAIAINAALDYMESIGGGVVHLSSRKYNILTQILIPEKCELNGCGMNSSIIYANDDMNIELNCITSKNNPMNKVKANGLDSSLEQYEYISGISIKNLMVDGNIRNRYHQIEKGISISELQSCGIKLTSVINSEIKNCFVFDTLMHCYDISASNYFDDGDITHNILGGCHNITISRCIGVNSLYDDIFTTHNSDRVLIENCTAINDGSNPYMIWGNNQHGFEVDEGSSNVTVVDCKSTGLICGFQAKGHDTTKPAVNVSFIRCHAIDCLWSFFTDHLSFKSIRVADNVVFDNCISENCHADENKKYNETIDINNINYRPRAFWIRGYSGVVIRDSIIIGGNGLVELDSGSKSVKIDGVRWKYGYNGVFSGGSSAGAINIISNETYGSHIINNIIIYDPIKIPAIRCVDNKLINGINISNIQSITEDNTLPCILVTLNIPCNIAGILSIGYKNILEDSSEVGSARYYGDGLVFSIVNGYAKILTDDTPNGGVHPPKIGNTAISKKTGVNYYCQLGESGRVWTKFL